MVLVSIIFLLVCVCTSFGQTWCLMPCCKVVDLVCLVRMQGMKIVWQVFTSCFSALFYPIKYVFWAGYEKFDHWKNPYLIVS